jgi:VWFA-related protein
VIGRFAGPLLVLLALCGLAGSRQPPVHAAQRPVFRTSVDSVVVDVSVRREGAPVTDLVPGDFSLTDNGRPQTIVDVSREAMPIDVELVVDVSGSMQGPRYVALVRAVEEVRARLRPSDRVRLVTFNERIREIGTLTGPGAGLPAGGPGGMTAVYDAIVAALIRPLEPNRRHMAIVFTDGVDVSSVLGEDDVVDVAARAGITVFGVALEEPSVFDPARGGGLFRRLAETTGGVFTTVRRDDDLRRPFIQAIEEFGTSYVLRYTPDDRAAGWHDIAVRVTRAGTFDVRARQGYFATAGTIAACGTAEIC